MRFLANDFAYMINDFIYVDSFSFVSQIDRVKRFLMLRILVVHVAVRMV